MRKFFAAVGAAALLSLGGLATATAASANPLPSVTASTSVTHHPDTTAPSPNDGFCTTSPGGPVWALDTYTSSMTAVNISGNDWTVSITDNGSFAGFALPTDCASAVSHGSFTGTYTVNVVSPTAPVASDLHANYDGAVSTSTMVSDFFGGLSTSDIAGGAYDFSYQGGNYVQTTDSITGAIVPDACTVTIAAIPDQSGVLGDTVSGLQVKATTNEATPPSNLIYLISGLPHSLHPNSTGLISGTLTGPTGTSLVTVKVVNTAFPQGENREACMATTTFKWTVALTAPAPTPTPTPTGTPGTTGGGNVPTGAPATGGGTLPAGNPTGQVVGIVILLGVGLSLTVGYVLRRIHQN